MSEIVITGASKGIGKAIRKLLAITQEVVPYDMSRKTGYDFSTNSGINKACLYISMVKPKVLILNHGVWDNDSIFKINLESTVEIARFARSVMVNAKIKGHIVFILSNSAYEGFAGNEEYSATKGGLLSFARCLQKSSEPYGINVITISPGTTNTQMWKQAKTDNRRKCKPIQPWEIAELVNLAICIPSCVSELIIKPRKK